jgi:hypothetical protein
MGNSDLTPRRRWFPGQAEEGDEGPEPAHAAEGPSPAAEGPSLAHMIRRGDPDVIAGFRDAHVEQVRRYCEEACVPERLEEAVDAAFADFVGRVRAAEGSDLPLDDMLLPATRSAAAARFRIVHPPGTHRALRRSGDSQLCEVIPELLAARANGELRGSAQAVQEHVDHCATCSGTDARMLVASRAFGQTARWEPRAKREARAAEVGAEEAATARDVRAEPEPEPIAETEPKPAPEQPEAPAEPESEAVAEPDPEPEPEQDVTPAIPTPHVTVKRRQGGLVGASRGLLARALGLGGGTPRRRE